MGFFKGVLRFFGGILKFFGGVLKDVLKKVLIFVITIFLILLAIKYFFGIDTFKLIS